MIRFFSKMRYKLAAENRAAKYLRYAIGEILLVVLGILFALQVNNWNESRKTAIFEKDILSLIDQNLESDSIYLSQELFKTKQAIAYTNRLLEQVSLKNYSDSLNYWMGKIISFERFKAQSSAFEVLKSKGIDIIPDKKLQIALISYYDESLFRLYQSLNDVEQSFKVDWEPVLKDNFSDFVWTQYCVPKDSRKFFEKPSTIVLFKIYSDNRAGTVRNGEKTIEKISEIRKLLKNNTK